MKKKSCLLIFLLVFSTALVAQVVLVPLDNDVYDFLERMQVKGMTGRYFDGIKPMPRTDIREYLVHIDDYDEYANLSLHDIEQLQRFLDEFSYESKYTPSIEEISSRFIEEFINVLLDEDADTTYTEEEKWKLLKFPYKFYSGDSYISFEPKFQAEHNVNSSDTATFAENYQRLTGGGYIFGYLGDNIGFSFDGVNNAVNGNIFDVKKIDCSDQGIGVEHEREGRYYYEEVDAAVSFSTKYADLTIGRFSNYWGCGHTGSVSLSNKAPSYPQVMVRAKFSDWLRFVYFHGWLESNILDDSTSYLIHYEEDQTFDREFYKKKYVAAHRLEIAPSDRFSFGLSELLYYGERDAECVYFIPIMLFWSAQRYTNDQDNEMIGLDYEWIPFLGLKTYGSLLIDEIALSKIFKKNESHNYVAYQLGAYIVEPFMTGLDFRIEYTHVNPWVYTHKFPINYATSDDYWMGYWTGQNADNLYFGIDFQVNTKCKLSMDYSIYRKGAQDSIKYQYKIPPVEKFMYGHQYTKNTFSINCSYELLPELEAEIGFKYTDCDVNKHNITLAEQGEYVNPVYYKSDFTQKTLSVLLSYRFD
ncbi:MAG: hypothetical protein JW794_04640 [Candidatus Cloacimonetes bacterium]|nr:hypothetical protein [Candidatus Cloacimonadota bacterium]